LNVNASISAPPKNGYKSDGLFRIPDSAQGSLTTILALWRLSEVRSGFGGRCCTGVNLLGPDGNVVCEPDYCFLRVDDFSTKYDLVLGEAKGFMDYEVDKIARLTQIANNLDKKPYLAFATLKDQFNDQEKGLLRGHGSNLIGTTSGNDLRTLLRSTSSASMICQRVAFT
jgi:hypothetical protein